jgi:hypothetical protein
LEAVTPVDFYKIGGRPLATFSHSSWSPVRAFRPNDFKGSWTQNAWHGYHYSTLWYEFTHPMNIRIIDFNGGAPYSSKFEEDMF